MEPTAPNHNNLSTAVIAPLLVRHTKGHSVAVVPGQWERFIKISRDDSLVVVDISSNASRLHASHFYHDVAKELDARDLVLANMTLDAKTLKLLVLRKDRRRRVAKRPRDMYVLREQRGGPEDEHRIPVPLHDADEKHVLIEAQRHLAEDMGSLRGGNRPADMYATPTSRGIALHHLDALRSDDMQYMLERARAIVGYDVPNGVPEHCSVDWERVVVPYHHHQHHHEDSNSSNASVLLFRVHINVVAANHNVVVSTTGNYNG